MDTAGVKYRREDNCFSWVADVRRAQALLNEQHRTDWPKLMAPLVELCHPLHAEITRPIERDYYWTAAESEYASDVMFRDWAALERVYQALVHRRAQVSRAATERYLTALAAVPVSTPLAQEAVSVCQPVRREGRRHRALNPFADADTSIRSNGPGTAHHHCAAPCPGQ